MAEEKQNEGVRFTSRGNGAESVDISEKGRNAEGETVSTERRLYMQFHGYGGCTDIEPLVQALNQSSINGVLYLDANDPTGVGFLTFSDNPEYFVSDVRKVLSSQPFSSLIYKPEYDMFGRTYTIGYESDLEATLIKRPISRVIDPELKWAVWYPLRREGTFEQLSSDEQNTALMEHGGIGRAFGRARLAYDIRLACHGMDKNDNDFVVALLGSDLAPLSKVVQRMRKTVQTSQHMQHMGPFFVGKVVWQNDSSQ